MSSSTRLVNNKLGDFDSGKNYLFNFDEMSCGNKEGGSDHCDKYNKKESEGQREDQELDNRIC